MFQQNLTTSGRSHAQDTVICALIGLSRAAEGKEIPPSAAPVLFASLAAVTPGDSLSEQAAKDLVDQIHAQKAILSPDCSSCPSPCGRTADFLLEDLNRTDDGLFDGRNLLLSTLSQKAKEKWKDLLSGSMKDDLVRLFMDSVFMAGYAYENDLFSPYLEKLSAI